MFCPFCGHADGTPGLKCVRCGEDLPRGKGGTVVIDDRPAPSPEQLMALANPPASDITITSASASSARWSAEPFVAQVSRSAVSHAGCDPDEPAYIPEPLPTPRPIAAIPPSPAVLVVQPVYEAVQPPAIGATQQSMPAQEDPQPETVRAPQLEACDSRAGLVARAVSGGFSLLSGSVLLTVSLFLIPAWIREMRIFDAPSFAPGVLAVAAAAAGALEVVAGLRMLAGSAMPQWTYALAFLAQLFGSVASVLVSAWNTRRGQLEFPGDVLFMAAVLAAAMAPALARIVLMILPTSGRILGARALGPGATMRAVPFVLWAPVTAGLAGPLLPLLVVGSIVAFTQGVKPSHTVGMIVGLTAVLLLGATLCANLVAATAMLRQARWAVALGGASGLTGSVLGLAVAGATVALLTTAQHLPFQAVGTFASLALVIASIVTPSLVLAAGALKFRFRLPPYLAQPRDADGHNPGLLTMLVPPFAP